jgi:hypothetical protein
MALSLVPGRVGYRASASEGKKKSDLMVVDFFARRKFKDAIEQVRLAAGKLERPHVMSTNVITTFDWRNLRAVYIWVRTAPRE